MNLIDLAESGFAYGDSDVISDKWGVQCPICYNQELHQIDVEVIFRDEDCDGLSTKVKNNSCKTEVAKSHEIPLRRDSILIKFACEHCHGDPKLDNRRLNLLIAQHKGSTIIKWVNL